MNDGSAQTVSFFVVMTVLIITRGRRIVTIIAYMIFHLRIRVLNRMLCNNQTFLFTVNTLEVIV